MIFNIGGVPPVSDVEQVPYSAICTMVNHTGAGGNVYYYDGDGSTGVSVGSGNVSVELLYPIVWTTINVKGSDISVVRGYPSGYYAGDIVSVDSINYREA